VDGLPVVIHGRGFPHRAVPENLSLEYPPVQPGVFNVGVLHTSLTGRLGHDTYAPCSEEDLRGKGYQYWALGHVHQPEVIAQEPWIVFAGNCQGRHARETGPRGCFLVTVNDALEVESAEWRALDVVRWEQVAVDLTGVAEEPEALARVRKGLEAAIATAEGRLLAARVVLAGACPLHGVLHREHQRLRAEIQAIAQDLGVQALWLEEVKVETSPVYDLAEMAQRDDLTQVVLETLELGGRGSAQAGPISSISSIPSLAPETALPEEISEMLEALPHELRSEVEKDLSPCALPALLDEIRSITLEALQTKGGLQP
jgi:DNA repair exonuclease SbcCD nuclease subunit